MDSQDWEPPTEAEMKLIEARRERSDRISKIMSGYLLKGYKMLGVVCSDCETILLQDRQGKNYCVACSELESDTDKDNPLNNQAAAKSMIKEMEHSASVVLTSESKSIGTIKTVTNGPCQHSSSHAEAETGLPAISSAAGETTPTVNATGVGAKHWSLKLDYSQKGQNGAASSSELHKKQETVIREKDADSGYPSLAETSTMPCSQHRKRHANASSHAVMSALLEPSSTTMPISMLMEKIDWAGKELKDTASVEYSIHLCHLIKAAAEAVVAVRSARI